MNAIPAFISAKVGVIVFDERRENLFNGFVVTWLGGSDEVVVGDTHGIPKASEFDSDLIDESLRRNTFGFGVFLNLFAVLV